MAGGWLAFWSFLGRPRVARVYDPGMNIVCGDAFGVSCGTWIAFWNGAIGAFVAAVLGGVVALIVVRLTNAQQRHGVDRTVEVAAVADFVAAIEELERVVLYRLEDPRTFDALPYTLRMRAAITRLSLSRKAAVPVADQLYLWPTALEILVEAYLTAKREDYARSKELAQKLSYVCDAAARWLPICASRSKIEMIRGRHYLGEAHTSLMKTVVDLSDGRGGLLNKQRNEEPST